MLTFYRRTGRPINVYVVVKCRVTIHRDYTTYSDSFRHLFTYLLTSYTYSHISFKLVTLILHLLTLMLEVARLQRIEVDPLVS